MINIPLWDPATNQDPNMTNKIFLREYVVQLLTSAFPNLNQGQIRTYVNGLFDLCNDLPAFKNYLRDFLVQLKVIPIILRIYD